MVRHPVWSSILMALVAAVLITALNVSSGGGGIPNSDDLLRMVTVRDLLGGQSWFDPMQYRLGLDGGTLMHWSRLVDAPIAIIYVIAQSLTGNAAVAEKVALITWPATTLFLAILAVMIACLRLKIENMRGPALIIASVAFLSIGIFGAGAIDHHNIQVALAMWLLAMLMPGDNEIFAHSLAGLIAVLMLAIGMETLPYVALAGIWVALGLMFGFVSRQAARAFGLSLGISSLIVYGLTVAPKFYGAVYCDAYSTFHIGMCAVGGFGLALTTHFTSSFKTRVIGLTFVALVAGALLLTIFSDCLGNPLLALDPKLRTFWLDGVVETRSIGDLWADDPFALFGMFGMAAFALIISLYLAKAHTGKLRQFAVLSALFLVAALIVTAWQQRGMMFAASFAILPLSFSLTQLRARYHETKETTDLLKMVGIGILSLNMVWWIAGSSAASLLAQGPTLQQQISAASPRDYCYGQDVYAALAKEPAGVVLGATDIGASVLKFTHHRALAGPYHRNTAGNLAMIEAMLAAPDEARIIMKQAGVTIIADCLNSADANDFKKAAPNGLQAQLHKGNIPGWLERVESTADEPLVLYRVKRDLL